MTPNKKVCANCKIEKAASDFRLFQTGKRKGTLSHRCKSCNEKSISGKVNYPKSKPINPKMKNETDLTKKVNLDDLLDLNGWTTQELKEFLLTVVTYRKAPHRMRPREIYDTFFPSRGSAACGQVMVEFQEAAENGFLGAEGFDRYIKTGRKYRRDGKKVVAPAKS